MTVKNFTTHECRWPTCLERVELWRWGCSKHWFRLPEHVRKAITNTWAKGKGKYSSEYARACEAAQEWIVANTMAGGTPLA